MDLLIRDGLIHLIHRLSDRTEVLFALLHITSGIASGARGIDEYDGRYPRG
jgi:hypothetical protein